MFRWALFTSVLAVLGCDATPRPSRPHVLLITIDTLRDDHCSVSGYERPTTPGLESLAERGARLTQAYSPTATTGPTHASILTSLYPIAHGVRKNGMSLAPELETLAETLGRAGYRTAGVVSSFVLDSKFGYDQGFETYDDDFDPETATIRRPQFEGHEVGGVFDRRANGTTDRAIAAVDAHATGARPFFLFVHYFDPHFPYLPPAPFDSRFSGGDAEETDLAAILAAYDGEIAFADREIGRLLRHLRDAGIEDETLVVVTADHGEGLMDHGHLLHGVHIYEEAVRVPLIVAWPRRVARGLALAGPVELLDVMPTILDLVDIEAPSALQGRSLAAALRGLEPLDPERAVYLHRRHYEAQQVLDTTVAGEKFGIRAGRYKYIEGEAEGSRELFDLERDPQERVNLIARSPEVADALRDRLSDWQRTRGRAEAGPPRVDPEDAERLRALGYTN